MNQIILITFLVIINNISSIQSDDWINGQVYNGDVTYYTEWKDSFGSCGIPLPFPNDYIAALPIRFMKLPKNVFNPNNHPLCGPRYCVKVMGPLGGLVLKVTDTNGCGGNCLDVADTVFGKLADKDLGRVKMDWMFVDCNENPVGPL
jgi:hypothetical protein